MYSLIVSLPVLLLYLSCEPLKVTTVQGGGAIVVKGIVYSLPPKVAPIVDETVEIKVFAPVGDASGQLLRGPDGRLLNGNLILATTAQPDGHFDIRLPIVQGQPLQIVNVEFNRQGKAITQRLNGIVLEEGRPYLVDITVPDPKEMPGYHDSCAPLRFKSSRMSCRGLFHR